MMNKMKYAFGALLSMMLLFSACSQADEPQQVSATELKKDVKMREVEIEFTLDVQDVDQLRAFYQKAGADGKIKTFISEGTELRLEMHAYYTAPAENEYASPTTNTATDHFVAKKVLGRNEGFYSGHLADINTQKYKAQIFVPDVFGATQYLVVRGYVVGSQKNDSEIKEADKDGLFPLSSVVFSTDPIEVTAGAFYPMQLPRLQLKPRGTLLSMHLKNETDQPAQVKGIQFVTNAIYFPYYTPRPFGLYPAPGMSPFGDVAPSGPQQTVKYLPGDGVTVPPNSTKTYYIWGVPYRFIPGRTPSTLIRAIGPNSEVYSPFYSEESLSSGAHLNMTLRLSPQKALTPAEAFPGGHMPLAYMAEEDMSGPNTLGSSARLTYQDLGPDPASGVSITGAEALGYYLPNISQIKAAFPSVSFSPSPGSSTPIVFAKEVAPLSAYGINRDYYSQWNEYVYEEYPSVYLLRFIGHGNKYLTAYRYSDLGSSVEIRARYLGPTFVGVYEDISNEEFWSKPHPYEVVRIVDKSFASYEEETIPYLAVGGAWGIGRPHYTAYEWGISNSLSSSVTRGRVRLFMRNLPKK